MNSYNLLTTSESSSDTFRLSWCAQVGQRLKIKSIYILNLELNRLVFIFGMGEGPPGPLISKSSFVSEV